MSDREVQFNGLLTSIYKIKWQLRLKRALMSCLVLLLMLMVNQTRGEGLSYNQEVTSVISQNVRFDSITGKNLSNHASIAYRSNPPQGIAQIDSSERADTGPVEMLRQIPGPKFLAIFVGLIVVFYCIVWLFINIDGTTKYPLPKITCFDPFEIAALGGGTAAVIRTAVFSLWNQDLVEISGSRGWQAELKTVPRNRAKATSDSGMKELLNSLDKEEYIYFKKTESKVLDPIVEEIKKSLEKPDCKVKTAPPQKIILNPIEEEIYTYLQTPRKRKDLFRDSSLKHRIEQHLDPACEEFEKLQLTRTKKQNVGLRMIIIAMAFLVVLIGGTKLYLGITYNKPVVFLVILLVFMLAGLSPICRFGNLTKLGQRYLKVLEEHYDWLKEPVNLIRTPEGYDPVLSFAIFGVGIMSGVSKYEDFIAVFPSNKSDGFGFGGGCGGGGCGGGGCGGGCGGCGG